MKRVITCAECGELKPQHGKGLCARCYGRQYRADNADHIAAYLNAYRVENAEKIAAQVKVYREENKEDIAAHKKVYREVNREEIAAQVKVYREENKEARAVYNKVYRDAHREEENIQHKKYRAANPDKVREWRHERRTYLCDYTDCIKLNHAFIGCDFHHLTPDTGVHVPATLHRSASHSLKTGEGMQEINRMAMEWLHDIRGDSPQTTFEAFV